MHSDLLSLEPVSVQRLNFLGLVLVVSGLGKKRTLCKTPEPFRYLPDTINHQHSSLKQVSSVREIKSQMKDEALGTPENPSGPPWFRSPLQSMKHTLEGTEQTLVVL